MQTWEFSDAFWANRSLAHSWLWDCNLSRLALLCCRTAINLSLDLSCTLASSRPMQCLIAASSSGAPAAAGCMTAFKEARSRLPAKIGSSGIRNAWHALWADRNGRAHLASVGCCTHAEIGSCMQACGMPPVLQLALT